MIKGKCIVCNKEVELPALNEMLVLADISIPIICKDCKGEEVEAPKIVSNRSRRRRPEDNESDT